MIALLMALISLGVLAPAAGADGVGPTNFRSEITGMEPETGSVEVVVVGSDAFMEVSAEPGTAVMIPGYEGEPYLRIDADGSLWRNENSPARFLNDSRAGNSPIPRDLPDPHDPDWRSIGDGGVVAWHDHRIHWMSDQVPATDPDGAVMEWQVPLMVDGVDTMVTGTLFHAGDQLPWPLLVTAIAAGLVVLAALRRRHGILTAALVTASVAAVLVSLSVILADPPDSGRSPVTIILAVAAVIASLAVVVPGDRPPIVRLAAPLATAALLIGWMIPFVGVFWMPYVPAAAPGMTITGAAVAVIRVLTGYVAGVIIATVVVAAVRPTAVVGDDGRDGPDSGPAALVDR